MHSNGALQRRGNPLNGNFFESNKSSGLAKRDSAELAAGVLPVFYPKGGIFFLEGQPATGIFLLRAGRAKESMASDKGKTTIVRIVGPGVILGLSAVLAGAVYESTVETLEATHADFVWKGPFLRLLKTSGQMAQMVAGQLSRNCKEAYASIRCLGVSASVQERVARLLIQWAECPLPNQTRDVGLRIRVGLTHEEISQFVGSTRETTSRVLSEFREKNWITMNGSTWTIHNKNAIRRMAAV